MRFAKEASVRKSELFSDIDTLDVQARQETLKIRGDPQLLQLPLVPAYALTTGGGKQREGLQEEIASLSSFARSLPGSTRLRPSRSVIASMAVWKASSHKARFTCLFLGQLTRGTWCSSVYHHAT